VKTAPPSGPWYQRAGISLAAPLPVLPLYHIVLYPPSPLRRAARDILATTAYGSDMAFAKTLCLPCLPAPALRSLLLTPSLPSLPSHFAVPCPMLLPLFLAHHAAACLSSLPLLRVLCFVGSLPLLLCLSLPISGMHPLPIPSIFSPLYSKLCLLFSLC